MKKLLNTPFFIRLFHWEYWSFGMVYGPIYLYWFWLCLRARSFFFFNTANPLIKNGGFLMESKKEIYDLIPPAYYPRTLLFSAGTSGKTILLEVENEKLSFPLIGKPDIGMRGLAVQKLESQEEVLAYAAQSKVDFLLQEFVPYENEVGIFYYRYPNQAKGTISGIVGKEFLAITGDGISTIKQLLQKDARFILQLPTLENDFPQEMDLILPENENHLMVPYGNHARGAKFLDISHLTDQLLTETIDAISQSIPEFYYGRMDIRYRSWEELKKGEHFSIIELNGSGSEPTHIYDPKHSIFFAWREIIRHWNILLKISKHIHHTTQQPYLSFTEGMQMFKDNHAYVKLIQPSAKHSKL